MDKPSTEHLAALARRVEDDPFFLASALKAYAESEGLADGPLAERLGIPTEALPALRLCRRPDPGAQGFRRDVDRIATRFGIRGGAIAQVIRQADALNALHGASKAPGGELRAARDRHTPGDEGSEGE